MGRDHSTIFKLVLHHMQMTLAHLKIVRTGFTIFTGNEHCFLVFKFFFSMTAMVYKLTSAEDCCCMQHWQATLDYLPCLAAFAVTSTGSSEAYSLRHSLQIAFILFITCLIQNSNIFCPQSLNFPLSVSSTLFCQQLGIHIFLKTEQQQKRTEATCILWQSELLNQQSWQSIGIQKWDFKHHNPLQYLL